MIKPGFVLLLLVKLSFIPQLLLAEGIVVAVAANFTQTMKQITHEFERVSGHRVSVVSGSSGKLYAQISNGAPFDIFFSADSEKTQLLEQSGKGVKDSRWIYARGKLVLWSQKNITQQALKEAFMSGHFNRLAIANARLAPYGAAAEQLLQNLNLASQWSVRLIKGENIAQVFQFVSSGSVDFGLVAASQLTGQWQHKGSQWVIPEHLYPPIEQEAILLTRAAKNPIAKAFIHYVKSPAVVNKIVSFGYAVQRERAK